MKIDKKRIKIILFCVLISLSQITYTCLDYNATITIIAKGLRYFIYIALVVINLTEFKKEDFNIKYILLGILAILITLFSHKTYVIITLILIWSMRKVKFKTILQYAVPSIAVTFLIIVTLSLIGLIPNWSSVRADGRMRYYLGYQFATIPSTYVFVILLLRFYQKGKNIKLLEILYEFIIIIFVYLKTNSRTGLYLSLLVLLIIFIYK